VSDSVKEWGMKKVPPVGCLTVGTKMLAVQGGFCAIKSKKSAHLRVRIFCLKRVKRSTGVGKTEKKVNFFLCCFLDKLELDDYFTMRS
jgi:hypothetical protein